MTQPTSVDMTFDTSLVDLNPNVSFSTTESDPTSDFGSAMATSHTPTLQQSRFGGQNPSTPTPSQPTSTMAIQSIPTQDAYNQWASVYDTDGNMLQAIDSSELSSLLPSFLSQVTSAFPSTTAIKILDLGCGTGRLTSKLLASTYSPNTSVSILGLDFSRAMLDIASAKLTPLLQSAQQKHTNISLSLACCDCFPTSTAHPTSLISSSPIPSVPGLLPASQHAIVSTLVLEHIPLPSFFATVSALLVPGGFSIITNMHADMGAMSQAGFVNAEGIKVRAGKSAAYTVAQTVDAAQDAGLEVLDVRERKVVKEDIEKGIVGERGWKWVGVNVWYCVMVRKGM